MNPISYCQLYKFCREFILSEIQSKSLRKFCLEHNLDYTTANIIKNNVDCNNTRRKFPSFLSKIYKISEKKDIISELYFHIK